MTAICFQLKRELKHVVTQAQSMKSWDKSITCSQIKQVRSLETLWNSNHLLSMINNMEILMGTKIETKGDQCEKKMNEV